uniref:Uncharacterized protein n=1 Tax=Isometrus maculatus TaxID=497827 RepID=A0A0U1TZC6_ISOMC|nr:hypothetical protein [Isometrus maculatus]
MNFWITFIRLIVVLSIVFAFQIAVAKAACVTHEDCTLLCYDTIGTCVDGKCKCM